MNFNFYFQLFRKGAMEDLCARFLLASTDKHLELFESHLKNNTKIKKKKRFFIKKNERRLGNYQSVTCGDCLLNNK